MKFVLPMAKFALLFATLSVTFHPDTGPRFSTAQAESQDACAIWLCLPASFDPSDCADAQVEFEKRNATGQPPLPPLSSCSEDSGSGGGSGSYKQGYSPYEDCREGYDARTTRAVGHDGGQATRSCVNPSSCRTYHSGDTEETKCTDFYSPKRRDKPYYIDLTVDGQPFGRYYYSRR